MFWNNNKPVAVPIICNHCGNHVLAILSIDDNTNLLVGSCPNCEGYISISCNGDFDDVLLDCSIKVDIGNESRKISIKQTTPVEIVFELLLLLSFMYNDNNMPVLIIQEILKLLDSKYGDNYA